MVLLVCALSFDIENLTLLCSFAELSKVLEPGKAAKTDKSSIITDAIRVVTQLRAENGQLRQLNKFLEVGAPSKFGSNSFRMHTIRHL